MAFTGTAVITKVSESKFRITGLSLAGAAAGTISLSGGTGAVKVDAPQWQPFQSSGLQGGNVDLSESVECIVIPADVAATAAIGAQTPAVVKTGTTPSDFLVTITNRNAASAASGGLEIYLTFC